MKRSGKILILAISLFLMVSAVTIGVLAGTLQSGGLNGTVSYNAVDVALEWYGSVQGSTNNQTQSGTVDVLDDVADRKWTVGSLSYRESDNHAPIVVSFFIKNIFTSGNTDMLVISGINQTGNLWDQTINNCTVSIKYGVSTSTVSTITNTCVNFDSGTAVSNYSSISSVSVLPGRVFGIQITITPTTTGWVDGIDSDNFNLPLNITRAKQ